jgi:uncharacterized membrane protein
MAPTNFLGLTSLGTLHTAIGLIALIAGSIALVRDRRISAGNLVGKVYLLATIILAVTGFGIFQHGGFGKPHTLGIATLVVLGIVAVAANTSFYGRFSRYVETVGYSATFLFNWIPTVAEGTTRLPPGAPLFSSPEAPAIQGITGFLFLAFLVGATLQVRQLRAQQRAAPAPA